MADRDKFDTNGSEEGSTPQSTPTPAVSTDAQSKADAKSDFSALPDVESPSISPAIDEPVAIDEPAIEPKPEPEVEAATRVTPFALVPLSKRVDDTPFEPLDIDEPQGFTLKPRHKRTMRLAAAVAIGAGVGAIIGILATGGAGAPPVDVAAKEENKAMLQSVTKLTQEVTTLKASLAAVTKSTHAQVAGLDRKIGQRIDERLKKEKEAADITGSISAPQTVAAAPATAAVPLPDVPTPRPAPRVAMAEPQRSAHPPVVRDWSIRGARNGFVYVEGRRGDIYEIVPGAPLPGLGPVQSIRRLDGRWVVTTPKGIIVSMRDRRYFE